jgi:dynein light chain roadblock-type
MADIALVEETEKLIRSNKGVIGFLVVNGDGLAIRSSLSDADTVHYAALVSRYTAKCRSFIKKLCTDDDVQTVRIRSAKHEIIIAPDNCGATDYQMVVIQDPKCA